MKLEINLSVAVEDGKLLKMAGPVTVTPILADHADYVYNMKRAIHFLEASIAGYKMSVGIPIEHPLKDYSLEG
jgi:hypothetical protein